MFRRRPHRGLWDRMDVGTWTDRSPRLLYLLFLRTRSGTLEDGRHGARRREAFAKLLMNLVAMKFDRHRWRRRLPSSGLVPEEVAQEAVAHLVRKSPRIVMRTPGWRPLLAIYNVSISRYVLSCLEGRRRKGGKPLAETDYMRHMPRGDGDPDGRGGGTLDERFAAPEPSTGEAAADAADLAALRDLLAGEAAAEAIIGDVQTQGGAAAEAVGAAYAFLVDHLLAGRGIATHAQLPRAVRENLARETHALIACRLNRAVRRYAARR